MKITSIRTLVLGTAIDEPIKTSFGTMNYRYMILVNVQTDEGLEGWGESWSNFPAWSPKERIHTINDGFAPLLIGEDPCNVEALHNKMRKASRILERQWGAPGPIAQAISALDIALWDISAKAQEKPLYQVWQAKPNKIPVYASALGPSDPTTLVQQMQAQGVKAFKLKLGFGLEKDKRNLKLMRGLISDDAQLMVDANQAWDAETTLEMADILEAHKITWLEEPIPADEWQSMAYLRKQLPFKLAAGENIFSSTSFKELLECEPLDIAQPDVCKVGGLSDMRAVCLDAVQRGLAFAPHYLGGTVGFLASLHLFAGTAGGLIMEYDPHQNPMREALSVGTYELRDGFVELKDDAGLGFDPQESIINKYLISQLIT